ncbi:MAG: Hsp70 family protein, partial [Methanotrichaceae archaeon]|nr:Hsp70 family protein [Methanotrichaceae archaeon]
LIERNTTIPTKKSQIFTTAADFQTAVDVHILQGERPMAKDNISLGLFRLDGIPPAPRGIPQIEVTYDIDVNGILHVSAKDLATKKEQNITISAPHKLNKEEIDAKIKDAERFAQEDAKRKEEIETRNEAESLIYNSEKLLKQAESVATQDQKDKIHKAIAELKEAQTGSDMVKIKDKTDALRNAISDLSVAMYQQAAAQQQQQQQAQQSQTAEADKTVDADYEVVNDKK